MTSKKPTVNVDHVAKQKKRKNLSNDMVYCSINGVVEMHHISKVEINGKSLGSILEENKKDRETLTNRLDNVKKINEQFNKKIIEIERKMKAYGIE